VHQALTTPSKLDRAKLASGKYHPRLSGTATAARLGPKRPTLAPSGTRKPGAATQKVSANGLSAATKTYGFGGAPTAKAAGNKKIFDDDWLDKVFPKKQTYHETAPKRKAGDRSEARGFAYTHGTKADESGSEEE